MAQSPIVNATPGNVVVPLSAIIDQLKDKLSSSQIDALLFAILSGRKTEVRPGDLITADFMNGILARLDAIEVRLAALEDGKSAKEKDQKETKEKDQKETKEKEKEQKEALKEALKEKEQKEALKEALKEKDQIEGGLPFTGLPFTGLPLAGLPFTGVPLAGLPFTGVPFTGVTSTGVPFTGVPFTGVPSTGAPLTGVRSTGVPSTGEPVAGISPATPGGAQPFIRPEERPPTGEGIITEPTGPKEPQ